jgi:hypothetical protein
LKGVKAVLKVTPEQRWHPGRSGAWETSVVPILSLEIGGATLESLITKMTRPARLFHEAQTVRRREQRAQFVVRESEEERAVEIADEFYPQNKGLLEEQTCATLESSEHEEQCAKICELAWQLGYEEAKTRMLLEQWAGNAAALEQKLRNEFDKRPRNITPGKLTNRSRRNGGQALVDSKTTTTKSLSHLFELLR